MIDITELTFAYNGHEVLDGVSLSVQNGELVGLIGPNGAGKTTLLRLTNAALEPDSGSIRIDDTDVHRVTSRAASQQVAVVPQETTLSFDFNVEQVVGMGRNPYKNRFDTTTKEDREIIQRALELTDTKSFADRSFSEISGGEQKRVLLARAIAQSTQNLLIDEPTASLDINHQYAVFTLVSQLVGEDKAVLAAIHDLDLAGRFCDRLALLAEGRIVASGPPKSVLQPDILSNAYGIDTSVLEHPETGTPIVVPNPTDTNLDEFGHQ